MATFTVELPDIGEGVVEGEVIEWLKQPGDAVAKDETVVIVMTDKATVELPAPKEGKLQKQHFKEGETAIVHKPLYDLEISGEIEAKEEAKPQAPSYQRQEKESPKPKAQGEKVLATPHTRALAKELGIDIRTVYGSGKEGRVLPQDLRGEGKRTGVLVLPGDHAEPLIGIPRRMAETMAEAKRIIPHFTYTEQADAKRLVKLKERIQQEANITGVHVTFMPLLLRALSLTLKKHPKVNASYDPSGPQLILHDQHNIGIAMSTPLGLIVPVLHEVERMSLEEIIRGYEELKRRARENKLQKSDMEGATISLTNYGALGGEGGFATPIITPPQAAILGIAKLQKIPVVRGDQVIAQETLNLSWSFDHRIIDGDLAASVSHTFATLIQNPAPLIT